MEFVRSRLLHWSMRVSVIVPTLNRKACLLGAIESLLAQTRPPFEILVVDNGSTDGTAQFLRERFGPPVELLHEGRRGVWFARNRGIGRARGEVLAFLDDDAEAAPDWIEKLVSCLEDTGAAGVGGPALAAWDEPPPAYLLGSKKARSYLGVFELHPRLRRLEGFHDFLVGTNCAFRRAVFDAGYRFLEIPWGRPTGGEDLELSRRIAASRPVYYDPEVVVHHKIFSRKMRLRYLARTAFDYGMKKVCLRRGLSPRGLRDFWGVDGFISIFSGVGYLWGLGRELLEGAAGKEYDLSNGPRSGEIP